MRRVAVIGDVAGHVGQLRDCLRELGVVDGTDWPWDLHVIQVGDLLGGRHDLDCTRLIEPHLHTGRWTQLVGNWELGAVGGPTIRNSRGRAADPEALAVFARWYRAGLVRFAATVPSADGRTTVVTHAGITQSWWRRYLGSEADPVQAALRINTAPWHALAHGGEMCDEAHLSPSPLWASVAELWRGWAAGGSMPWAQIHGHTTAYNPRQRWLSWVPPELTRYARPDAAHGHTHFTPPGQTSTILGIDPGLWERSARGSLHALVVPTAK